MEGWSHTALRMVGAMLGTLGEHRPDAEHPRAFPGTGLTVFSNDVLHELADD